MTKEELLDVVWKDTFVTPNVLTRAIVQARKAIGDTAIRSRYIETVSKRGYRFIAPVVVADEATGAVTVDPGLVLIVADLRRQTHVRIASQADVVTRPAWRDDRTVIYGRTDGQLEMMVMRQADGSGDEIPLTD